MITTSTTTIENKAVLKNNIVVGIIDSLVLKTAEIEFDLNPTPPEGGTLETPFSIENFKTQVVENTPEDSVKITKLITDNGKTYYVESLNENLVYVDYTLTANAPTINSTYDVEKNAFILPQPNENYVLNETTFEWHPDPEKEFDLHDDGKLYRYDPENNSWIPTWQD